MELAQITAGQVVMLFLLMGTGMLLAAGDLGCIVRSKTVWKLAAVRTGGHSAVTFSPPAFLWPVPADANLHLHEFCPFCRLSGHLWAVLPIVFHFTMKFYFIHAFPY